MAANFARSHESGTQLAVKLQPRASRNEIGSVQNDELKIRVTAPPVDSAANEALVRLLAERLSCAPSRIQILRGQTSRHKTLLIAGLEPTAVITRLTSSAAALS